MWVFWGLEEDYLMNYAPSYTTRMHFVCNLYTSKPSRDNSPHSGNVSGPVFSHCQKGRTALNFASITGGLVWEIPQETQQFAGMQ